MSTSPVAPPVRVAARAPHTYRWTILAVGFSAQAGLAALHQGMPVLAPALRDRYDLSLVQTSAALSAVNVGIMLTVYVWGALSDRIGERTVIATGLACAAVALALASAAGSYAVTLAALAAAGMFGGCSVAASGRAVMGWFEYRERGFALAVRQTAIPLGAALAGLILPLLLAGPGLRGALLALAGGCLAGAITAGIWLRDPPLTRAASDERAGAGRPGHPARDPRLWRLSLGGALLVFSQLSILSFLVLYLHAERDWTVAHAALALVCVHILSAVTRVMVGRWSDHSGRRITPIRRIALAATGSLALAVALFGAPTAVLLPALIAAGVIGMSWNALQYAAAGEMAGIARAGAALGIQTSVVWASGAAAPIVFGALVEATSWRAAFAVAALCPLAGWAVLRPLVSDERRRMAARAQAGSG